MASSSSSGGGRRRGGSGGSGSGGSGSGGIGKWIMDNKAFAFVIALAVVFGSIVVAPMVGGLFQGAQEAAQQDWQPIDPSDQANHKVWIGEALTEAQSAKAVLDELTTLRQRFSDGPGRDESLLKKLGPVQDAPAGTVDPLVGQWQQYLAEPVPVNASRIPLMVRECERLKLDVERWQEGKKPTYDPANVEAYRYVGAVGSGGSLTDQIVDARTILQLQVNRWKALETALAAKAEGPMTVQAAMLKAQADADAAHAAKLAAEKAKQDAAAAKAKRDAELAEQARQAKLARERAAAKATADTARIKQTVTLLQLLKDGGDWGMDGIVMPPGAGGDRQTIHAGAAVWAYYNSPVLFEKKVKMTLTQPLDYNPDNAAVRFGEYEALWRGRGFPNTHAAFRMIVDLTGDSICFLSREDGTKILTGITRPTQEDQNYLSFSGDSIVGPPSARTKQGLKEIPADIRALFTAAADQALLDWYDNTFLPAHKLK